MNTTLYEICGDTYRVTKLDGTHPEVAVAAYRLEKVGRDGVSYDVRVVPEGWSECACADCTFRQRECKHIRSLKAAGLIPTELGGAGRREAA